MNEVQYLYSCMGGSYYIPCKILNKHSKYVRGKFVEYWYTVEYIDPEIKEKERITISEHSKRLKFPEYSSYIL